jgi:hypothetical protein
VTHRILFFFPVQAPSIPPSTSGLGLHPDIQTAMSIAFAVELRNPGFPAASVSGLVIVPTVPRGVRSQRLLSTVTESLLREVFVAEVTHYRERSEDAVVLHADHPACAMNSKFFTTLIWSRKKNLDPNVRSNRWAP